MTPVHAINTRRRRLWGVYAVTPDCVNTADLLHRVHLALLGGISVLQYRNKTANEALRFEQAQALCQLAHAFFIPFIVNDDAQLAADVGADGVHLGVADGGITKARALLGRDKFIGVSCYNRLSLAQAAVAAGADYIAFGAFYPSSSKPLAIRATPELLQHARAEFAVPVVAIGGINLNNSVTLIQSGAHAVAVISALFDATDIRLATQNFAGLFAQHVAPAHTTKDLVT
ncbi:MAG: thiamine phosphate synthase [Candidatus Nitrotoga sp.]